ncbi:hypothetical protein [Synechocystis sp. PCC 7509]|uniref:hypothetical protein n=1 Tax=Synechocystis sp. PCC 7509 TaxID=927677 RepID=UPI0002AC1198|nr:hypothetical protein [Synechocystis sp. PCC 7509]
MKLTAKLPLVAIAALGFFTLITPQLAKAQSTDVNPLQDFQPQQGDPFSSRNDNPTGSLFDLIHRAQLGSSRSAEEFNTEKNQSLNDAAAEFRKKQQQRIQNPNQVGTIDSKTTTTTPSLQINLDR